MRLQVLESYEDYLFSILTEYLNYQKAYLDVELAKIVLREARRLNGNVVKKRREKIASKTDVDKSKLQVILREEDVLNRQKEVDEKWERVSAIVGESVHKAPTERAFSSLQKFYKRDGEKSEDEVDSLRVLKILDLQRKIADKTLMLAKRESQPALSLVGGYDIDNSKRFSSKVNRNEKVVGLKLVMPLGDTQVKANSMSASLDLSKAELDFKIKRRDLLVEMKQLLVRVNKLNQRRALINKKVNIAERIVRDERKRYNYGKIELDNLIEMESNFFRYKFQAQSEELEYNKAILEWLAKSDKLLDFKNEL